MTTLQTLQKWIATPTETENLEFKEAKEQYDNRKLLEYCVALANEGGGFLVMGVTDKKPRQVVGSRAFATEEARNKIKSWIFEKLNIRVNTIEIQHPNGRVLVFEIPTRPIGQPLAIDGSYLMRIGDKVLPMTVDQLKRIFAEGEPDWLNQPAIQNITADQIIALLDTQSFFDLLNIPYPTTRNGVLERLTIEELITPLDNGWSMSNLAALLLAKNLNDFPLLRRKAPRVIFYEGIGKFKTREDQTHYPGYAVGFENLINFIHSSAPQNYFIEQAARKEVKMVSVMNYSRGFPRSCLA
jgi:ATP-dependent DNA helicase RecG